MAAREVTWGRLIEDLRRFPGKALSLKAATSQGDLGSGSLTLELEVGDMFDCGRFQANVVVGRTATTIKIVKADESHEGVADIVQEVGRAVASSTGPSAARSAILRLCSDLDLEFSDEESALIAALGRAEAPRPTAAVLPAPSPKCLVPPAPLVRHTSQATSGGASAYSFESDDLEDLADIRAEEEGEVPPASASQSYSKRLRWEPPSVEDVVVWEATVSNLKSFRGSQLEVLSVGVWDGTEGLVELRLNNPDREVWDQLLVMLIVGPPQTRIELKRAQAIPDIVAAAVQEVNQLPSLGSRPPALAAAVRAVVEALQLKFDEFERQALEGLEDRQTVIKQRAWDWARNGEAKSELEREILAVDALKTQMGFIDAQIEHLEKRMLSAPCIEGQLQHELSCLRRTQAVLKVEISAAGAAVEAALIQLTDTSVSTGITIQVDLDARRPAQSLRGHEAEAAVTQIRTSLMSSGPWGHYAAYQFSTMLSREQEFDNDFVCLYHSYSFAAVLYEVHAEVARYIFGLPPDCAPLPRLSLASGAMCKDLKELQGKGGQDHDPAFRALGLSSSCSVFASGSEAPPLTCFQAGYSCTDVSFRGLLLAFLNQCMNKSKSAESEAMADAILEIAEQHKLYVDSYRSKNNPGSPQAPTLAGYMLQIFIHRSIVEKYAYPSKPMGTPLPGTLTDYVTTHGSKADGQARILFYPPTFVDPSQVRLFHYCARPLQSCMNASVPQSRGAFIKKLNKALEPIFKRETPQALARRLRLQ